MQKSEEKGGGRKQDETVINIRVCYKTYAYLVVSLLFIRTKLTTTEGSKIAHQSITYVYVA